MEAKNLRVGNIVRLISHSNTEGTVTEISSHYSEPHIRCKNTHNGIYLNHKGEKLVEGIPLSEDWLKKFGFKKVVVGDDSEYFYELKINEDKYCDSAILSNDENGFIEVTLFPYDEWFRYKYVHELQNLFFAITKNELELKTE